MLAASNQMPIYTFGLPPLPDLCGGAQCGVFIYIRLVGPRCAREVQLERHGPERVRAAARPRGRISWWCAQRGLHRAVLRTALPGRRRGGCPFYRAWDGVRGRPRGYIYGTQPSNSLSGRPATGAPPQAHHTPSPSPHTSPALTPTHPSHPPTHPPLPPIPLQHTTHGRI